MPVHTTKLRNAFALILQLAKQNMITEQEGRDNNQDAVFAEQQMALELVRDYLLHRGLI